MLSLTHDVSSSDRTITPLNAAEEIHAWVTRNEPPPAPPKKAFSLHIQPATKAETHFRHSFWKAKRAMVRAALESTGLQPFALDRFDQCGGECIVEYSVEAGKHRLKANYCHSRHCEPCMRAKANKLAANLRNRLNENPESVYRFVTLTLKHRNEPLADQIKRLYMSFRKLRAMKFWKTSQRGGAAMLEVKWIAKTRMWHPHLHVITEGDWIDKYELSRGWLQATGDSPIVDIRALPDSKAVAHYVCKYVAKGTNTEVWHDVDARQEWILALRGVRMCLTYGTWRGYGLMQTTEKYFDWKPVWSLSDLARAAAAGETAALLLYCKLDGWKMDDEKSHSTTKSRDKP